MITHFGSHLFNEGDRFESEAGVLRFNPQTLKTRVVDRAYHPFPRYLPALQRLEAEHGNEALRLLSIRLIRGMLMPELRDELPYAAVEELVVAAEDALEPGRTSYNFDRILEKHRNDVISAGMFGWMESGTQKFAAPPLLASAMLLDAPWTTLRTIFELAEWLDNIVSDGERDLLYAPDRASRVVENFLSQRIGGF